MASASISEFGSPAYVWSGEEWVPIQGEAIVNTETQEPSGKQGLLYFNPNNLILSIFNDGTWYYLATGSLRDLDGGNSDSEFLSTIDGGDSSSEYTLIYDGGTSNS
jgi:hypothetical protein